MELISHFLNRFFIMDFIILFFVLLIVNKLILSKVVENHPYLSTKTLNYLYFYHVFFFVVYYLTTIFSRSDSIQYYESARYIGGDWNIIQYTSTRFIDNFSAPFVSLGLSFESMMFLYAWFGYIGFVFAYIYFKENIKLNVTVFGKYDLLQLILFFPNMHFWTASLGKGSLIFMGLMMFTFAVKRPQKRLLFLLLGGYFVYMIRPPVMLFVLTGVMIGLLTGREKLSVGVRILIISASVFFLYSASNTILGVANIQSTETAVEDFQQYSNEQSDRLESSAGSGVAMQSYPLPFKLFTFWFRPLFVDSPSVLGLFSSAENLVYLLLFVKIFNKRFIGFIRKAPYLVKMSAITFLLASYAMTFVMSNLGIIMRQKSMVMYFGFFVIYYFLADEKQNKLNNEKALQVETI
jgi:hypothetical protein